MRLFSFLRSYLSSVLCVLVAVCFAAYSWSPLFSAQWSIVDDHEIVGTAGADDNFLLINIPAALGQTEISGTSTQNRFRPSYYTLRFTEVALWGKNPALWYGVRVLVAIAFAGLLAAAALHLSPPLLATAFALFVLSRPYWADIFARLGPAEHYAVAATCLIAVAAWGIHRTQYRAPSWFCLLALGVAISAGSKENFLILGVVLLGLLASKWSILSGSIKALLVLTLCYLAWIILSVAKRLRVTGHDVYAQDISAESRLLLVSRLLDRSDFQLWLTGCGALVVLAALVRLATTARGGEPNLLSDRLAQYALGSLALLVVFSVQYVFYFGRWPEVESPRYLFPGMLAQHFTMLLGAAALIAIVASAQPKFPLWIVTATLAGLFFAASLDDLRINKALSRQVVSETRAFTEKIEVISRELRSKPAVPVIFNSHSSGDYEALFSFQRFIRAEGLKNPIAISQEGYSAATLPARSLSRDLAKVIEQLQMDGGKGFTPFAEIPSDAECYSLGFHGKPLARCVAGLAVFP